MKDFSHISRLMRADWDRRIAHDYRFWMSDGHVSDEAMWASGQRDFEIITRGVDGLSNKTVLDLGCGVGRLLKAASAACGKIIGLDVSGEALKKARELIGPRPNLELMHGNGADLQPLADSSIDLVISFAALSSVPASVIANYLIEVNRVLKPGGVFRLQFYLGTEQQTGGEDTLHLRCYGRSNFENAVKAAGFTLRSLDELVLPLKVSFKELGIEAFVASLEKTERPQLESEAVEKLLLPSG